MTLRELIDELERIADERGDYDPEVRVAYQPSWPLAGRVTNVVHHDHVERDDEPDRDVVWIATEQVSSFGESPYAPRNVWEAS